MENKNLIERLRNSHAFTHILSGFHHVHLHQVQRQFSEEERDFAERAWKKVLAEEKGVYSNPLMSVYPEDMYVKETCLHLPVYPTEYKYYKTTLAHSDFRVWALGVSGIIKLESQREPVYIFGERKKNIAYIGGRVETVPAGFLEPKHLESQDPCKEALLQELVEEVGIPRNFVSGIRPLHIGQIRDACGRSYQDVCLDYELSVSGLSPQEVQLLFDQEQREHIGLSFVPLHELVSYLDASFHQLTVRTRFTLEYYLSLI